MYKRRQGMVQFLPISPELDKAQNSQQTNPASGQSGTASLNTRPYCPLLPVPGPRPFPFSFEGQGGNMCLCFSDYK